VEVAGANPKGSVSVIPTTRVFVPTTLSRCSGWATITSSLLKPWSRMAASTFLVPHGAYLTEPSPFTETYGQSIEKYSQSGISPFGAQALKPRKIPPRYSLIRVLSAVKTTLYPPLAFLAKK
jgi:hypothetical protein